MRELKCAFPKTIPVLTGYVFLGIIYGILMTTNGFPAWLPVLTALVIYTGSIEFLMVDILLSSFNPVSALVTALMIGARHIFYGISMLNKYRGTGKAKFYLIYTTSDETFALNYDAVIPHGCDRTKYYLAVSFLDQMYWVFGAALGAFFGSMITIPVQGLDFVMTAMFVSIFMNQWMKDRDELKKTAQASAAEDRKKISLQDWILRHAPELTGVAGSVFCLLIFGPDRFIVPSMIVILAILTLIRKPVEAVYDAAEEKDQEASVGEAAEEKHQKEADEMNQTEAVHEAAEEERI